MHAVFAAAEARMFRVATGPLNKLIGQAVATTPPAADSAGRRLHIYYATQPETRPPHFVLFVNDPRLWTDEYRRYLERRVRDAFGLRGTPVRWSLKGRRAVPSARSVDPPE
jgi:GTP-binding protein